METRKEDRFYGVKDLIIIDEGKEYNGILTSISLTGVSVIMDNIFPTYKEIGVKFNMNDESVTIRGSVRWVNDHKGQPGANLKEIGILFIDPPRKYIDYIENIKNK